MPSVLDATLVIQMVHFLCAYWILSTFFLKPAYALIMKIDAERAALKNAAVKQQEELTTQRREKTVEFAHIQQELLRSARVFKKSSVLTSAHPECSPQGNVSRDAHYSKSKLIKELAAQLKKRIIHE